MFLLLSLVFLVLVWILFLVFVFLFFRKIEVIDF